MCDIKNILFIRLSSLGDIVLTMPVIEALHKKFPRAALYYLTKSEYKDLLINHPLIEKTICIDTYDGISGMINIIRVIKDMRRLGVDLVIDSHFPHWSYFHLACLNFMLVNFTKAKSKILFSRPLFRKTTQSKARNPKHVIDYYSETLRKYGIELENKLPGIFVDDVEKVWAAKYLASRDLSENTLLIGICPGASYGTKQWSKDNFKLICQQLTSGTNNQILLFEQQGGEDLIRYISQGVDPSRIICAVGFSLKKVIALMNRCKLMLTNDSGLMHIASALGIPTIALFGPTHPKLGFFPLGNKNIVLCADFPCSPCSRWGERECRYHHHACLDTIKTQDVLAACANVMVAENRENINDKI
jgi:heptosyltransferase-2